MLWFNVSPSVFRFVHYIYTVLSVYLLFGLLCQFYKEHCNPCFRKCFLGNRQNYKSATIVRKSNSINVSGRKYSSHRMKYFGNYASALMMSLSLIAGTLTCLHVILDLWAFSKTSFRVQMLCSRQKWSGIMLFASALGVYTFLWMRQRVFYSHPVLRSLSGPNLNRFSWSVLFTIIFSITTFTAAYYSIPSNTILSSEKHKIIDYYVFHNATTWTVVTLKKEIDNSTEDNTDSNFDFRSQEVQCTFKSKILYLWSHLIITGTFLYFQISLQFLFAYPVLKRNRKRKSLFRRNLLSKKNNGRNTALEDEYVSTSNLYNCNSTISKGSAKTFTVSATFKINQPRISVSNDSLYKTQNLQKNFRYSFSESCLNQNSIRQNFLKDTKSLQNQFAKLNDKAENKLNFASTPMQLSKMNHSYSWNSKIFSLGKYSQASRSSKTKRKTSVNKKKSCRRLRRYVWRCFIVSLICCLSDMTAFLLNVYTQISTRHNYAQNFEGALEDENFILSKQTLNVTGDQQVNIYEERVTISLLSVVAYNGNMVINLICMVLCYDKYFSMFFPCFNKRSFKSCSK